MIEKEEYPEIDRSIINDSNFITRGRWKKLYARLNDLPHDLYAVLLTYRYKQGYNVVAQNILKNYIWILDNYAKRIEERPQDYYSPNRSINQLVKFSRRLKEELITTDEIRLRNKEINPLSVGNEAYMDTAKASVDRMRVFDKLIEEREREEEKKHKAKLKHEKKQARLEKIHKRRLEKIALDDKAREYRVKKLLENTGIL